MAKAPGQEVLKKNIYIVSTSLQSHLSIYYLFPLIYYFIYYYYGIHRLVCYMVIFTYLSVGHLTLSYLISRYCSQTPLSLGMLSPSSLNIVNVCHHHNSMVIKHK